jgi:hypothetical protein
MASSSGKLSLFPKHTASVARSKVVQKRGCCALPPKVTLHASHDSSNMGLFFPVPTTIMGGLGLRHVQCFWLPFKVIIPVTCFPLW